MLRKTYSSIAGTSIYNSIDLAGLLPLTLIQFQATSWTTAEAQHATRESFAGASYTRRRSLMSSELTRAWSSTDWHGSPSRDRQLMRRGSERWRQTPARSRLLLIPYDVRLCVWWRTQFTRLHTVHIPFGPTAVAYSVCLCIQIRIPSE